MFALVVLLATGDSLSGYGDHPFGAIVGDFRRIQWARGVDTETAKANFITMCDNLFPSGPWREYFLDRREPGPHRMDISLEFVNGRITGEGSDLVGSFIIGGRYDPGSGECHWTKSYIAAHDLFYEGIRVGKSISGIWELDSFHGGFKIWPLASGETDGDAETEKNEEVKPVDAVGELVGARKS